MVCLSFRLEKVTDLMGGQLVFNYFYFFTLKAHCVLVVALSEKKKVPFSMAIGNGELMH